MSMPPGLRRAALTAHITTSIGWTGAVIAFLVIAVTGLTTGDDQLMRGSLLTLAPLTWFAIVPLAAASLLTGIVQAVGTPWGLVRHYWVLCKLAITLIVSLLLLDYAGTITYLAKRAAEPATPAAGLQTMAVSPVIHASLALLALLVPTILSVFKPRGTTRFGQRG